MIFVPFLGDFFSMKEPIGRHSLTNIFVPFLGDFFSISYFFRTRNAQEVIFVPFLGDFFSMSLTWTR